MISIVIIVQLEHGEVGVHIIGAIATLSIHAGLEAGDVLRVVAVNAVKLDGGHGAVDAWMRAADAVWMQQPKC